MCLSRFDRLIEKDAAGKPRFADALALKLSPRQKEALFFNRFLLLLHSNKLDQARELVPALYEAFPGHDTPALLHAALLLQEKKASQAEELLTVGLGFGLGLGLRLGLWWVGVGV